MTLHKIGFVGGLAFALLEVRSCLVGGYKLFCWGGSSCFVGGLEVVLLGGYQLFCWGVSSCFVGG